MHVRGFYEWLERHKLSNDYVEFLKKSHMIHPTIIGRYKHRWLYDSALLLSAWVNHHINTWFTHFFVFRIFLFLFCAYHTTHKTVSHRINYVWTDGINYTIMSSSERKKSHSTNMSDHNRLFLLKISLAWFSSMKAQTIEL